MIATTGVERKHKMTDGITTSDLCLKAAEKLLQELGWDKESIDVVYYVTQTPDYTNQPTSFVIHDKLGLAENCMCLDLYHGCPGWVIGLGAASSLLSHGSVKRALLLDGDAITKMNFLSTARAALCLETVVQPQPWSTIPWGGVIAMQSGSRSKDGGSLIRKRGGYREPFTPETFTKEYEMLDGVVAPDADASVMDGMSVFSFGISVPPKSIKQLCEHFDIRLEDVDKIVLHQANAFMLKKIVKKLKVDPSKAPMSLRDYGNTTSASIPLTIVSQCREEYSTGHQKTICCGFGTGLSWATAYFETDNIVCPDVIVYNKDKDDKL